LAFRGEGQGEIVCDVKVYVARQGKEELLLEAVNHLRVEQGEVTVRNLFGEEKKVRGEVREVSLVKNRVVVDQE
jgi:predicted RNA-binding protein